jgi:hypothetical protein
MKDAEFSLGLMIGMGAAIGVLLMPLFGPLALAAGVGIGVVLGAAFAALRAPH